MHEYDHEYPGLAIILDGFDEMVEAKEPLNAHMGYREAEAAYMAVMALDWFGNFGPGYQRRLTRLQDQLADRIGNDPHEDVVILNPNE